MKVLITHSIGEDEQFWITRLAWQLREQNITPISGYSLDLIAANFVIGIATASGSTDVQFLEDYRIAQKKKIPFLLLIEKGCSIIDELTIDNNVVIFDRGNIELAIETAKNRFTIAEQNKFAPLSSLKEYWAWLVGGIVLIGIIGLIAKMANTDKKLETY
jgi:hypothetical protein